MNESKSNVDRVLGILKVEGVGDYHSKLSSALDQVNSNDIHVSKKGRENIQALCSSRVLGDLNIQSVSWKEWVNMISKLKKKYK
jgi:hypothetical protein